MRIHPIAWPVAVPYSPRLNVNRLQENTATSENMRLFLVFVLVFKKNFLKI
jgi:hypothetical protein